MAITSILADLAPLGGWLAAADAFNVATTQAAIDNVTNERIARWDSQGSTTQNLAQATANSQPKYTGASRNSGYPCALFENSSTSGANVGMSCTLTSSVGNRNTTIIIVSDAPHRQEQTTAGRNAIVGISGGGLGGIAVHRGSVLFIDGGVNGSTGSIVSPSTVDSGLRMPQSRSILVVRAGNGTTDPNYTVWSNRRTATATLRASVTSSNFILGATVGPNNPWVGRIYEAYVWNSALTDTQISDAISYLETKYNIDSNPADNIIIVGDSISASGPTITGSGGYVVPRDVSWPVLLSDQLAGQVTVHNCATSSATAAEFDSEFTTRIQPAIILSNGTGLSAPRNTMVMFAGSNDIANNGQTAAQVKASWVSIAAKARAAGVRKIIGVTFIPRNGSPAELTTFNAALRADPAGHGCDYVVDLYTTDYGLATKAYATLSGNRMLYSSDGVHPIPQGMSIIAQAVATTLRTQLNIGSGAVPSVASTFRTLRNR